MMERQNTTQKNIHPIRKDYMRKLEEIHVEDLKYLEDDLSFNEKASLAFLLFASDKVGAQYALQRLLVLANNPHNSNSNLLFDYATKINPNNWKNSLLEALTIIQAKRVIRKLGLNYLDLYAIFLPKIPAVALNVNSIVKGLYFLCEKLTYTEAGKLILHVQQIKNQQNDHFRFYDSKCLEVFLLHWINLSYISVGDWSNKKIAPNLDMILEYLKFNDNEVLKDLLLTVISFHTSDQNENKEKSVKLNEQESSEENRNYSNKKETIVQSNYNNERDSTSDRNEDFRKQDSFALNPDERYMIRKEMAGFILIINQKNFYRETDPKLQHLLPEEELKSRRGADKDKDSLKTIFSSFGYHPEIREDCSHLQMLNIIEKVVQISIVYDSLIVCILSHGVEGFVYGSNSIPVPIRKIKEIVASRRLIKKPKMLIIQACQERGNIPPNLSNSASHLNEDSEGNASESMTLQPMGFSDMVIAMSTVAGFSSIRNVERGTWFIQTLCKLIDELGDNRHILDILIAVNKKVTNMRGYENQCMVPETSQTLNKGFYLPKRY